MKVELTNDELGILRAALRVAVNRGSSHLEDSYKAMLARVEELQEQVRQTRQARKDVQARAKAKQENKHAAPWLKKALVAGYKKSDLMKRARANGLTLREVCETLTD